MMMMYNQCAMFKNMGATITEIYYNWYYFLPLYSVSEFFFSISIMLHRKHWAKLLVSSSVKTTFYGIFSSLWSVHGISEISCS